MNQKKLHLERSIYHHFTHRKARCRWIRNTGCRSRSHANDKDSSPELLPSGQFPRVLVPYWVARSFRRLFKLQNIFCICTFLYMHKIYFVYAHFCICTKYILYMHIFRRCRQTQGLHKRTTTTCTPTRQKKGHSTNHYIFLNTISYMPIRRHTNSRICLQKMQESSAFLISLDAASWVSPKTKYNSCLVVHV